MSGDRVAAALQHRLLGLVPRRTLHTWRSKLPASDAVLFGAGTLRAYGTTLTVSHPQLLQQRIHAGSLPNLSIYLLHILLASIRKYDSFSSKSCVGK